MKLGLIAVFLTLGAGVALSADEDKGHAAMRMDAAADAFHEVMGIPDKSIPQQLLNKAQCIVIVPDLKKAAFVFGAKYGKGFASCRKKNGVGWSAPGAIRVEGGSFGLQLGGEETDVFMLIMNERGMDRLLSTKFTLGADAVAAAGPVGRTAQADTDAALTAEILTWSRARGLFAGLSLNGATLREDGDWNRELYGKELKNREIITGNTAVPKAAAKLMAELNKYSSRK